MTLDGCRSRGSASAWLGLNFRLKRKCWLKARYQGLRHRRRKQEGVRHVEKNASSDKDFVGVWSIEDRGDVPPRWTIGGPQGALQHLHGIALDPKHQSVILTDKRLNAVLTFSFPEIF